jgi:F-type H+-transporting ATPase subunit a
MREQEMMPAIHETASHSVAAPGSGGEAQHELPNLITILNNLFPDADWAHFLHRWENIFFSLLAASLISIIAIRAARKKRIVPQGIQNFCELIVEGIDAFVTGILGERGREHVPFLGTLFLYILFMNWSGVIPLMKSSTASWSTTFALALTVMVYVQWTGIKEQGLFHYLKHMAGDPSNLFGLVLIPLMLIINMTIEFVAVPLSLSLRLFANISSEDRLLFKFAELNVLFKGLPFFFQLFANILALAFSLVQAFVFMLLSTVYISLILPHENHEHEKQVAHAH